MARNAQVALPYSQPSITTTLILTSFLLLLNIVNYILNKIIYCGLIGQILIGIAWGTPGTQWLSPDIEKTISNFGYLGLILLVYEGGLATSLPTLKSTATHSVGVAITGTALPIALSFVLIRLCHATPLQAFAAGAALCSTSLGTTVTVLNVCDLRTIRLGSVLMSAAMLDDVIGLVMIQVISNLGGRGEITAAAFVRPVGVSIAFATVLILTCRFIIRPLRKVWPTYQQTGSVKFLDRLLAQIL